MIYVPKVGEDYFKETKETISLIKDKLEIQLLTLDIYKWKRFIIDYFYHIETLNELIIHVPLEYVKMEVIYMNLELKRDFENFISWLNEYLRPRTDKKVKILFHFSLNYNELILSDMVGWISYLFRRIENNRISFVLENSIAILGYLKGTLLTKVLSLFNEDRVSFCFDLCHYNVLKYFMKDEVEFPKELFSRCSQVHFSYTKGNGLGKSHGMVHPNLTECEKDLICLKELGIDFNNVLIVAEINEEDYCLRPDLIREIDYLKSLSKKY